MAGLLDFTGSTVDGTTLNDILATDLPSSLVDATLTDTLSSPVDAGAFFDPSSGNIIDPNGTVLVTAQQLADKGLTGQQLIDPSATVGQLSGAVPPPIGGSAPVALDPAQFSRGVMDENTGNFVDGQTGRVILTSAQVDALGGDIAATDDAGNIYDSNGNVIGQVPGAGGGVASGITDFIKANPQLAGILATLGLGGVGLGLGRAVTGGGTTVRPPRLQTTPPTPGEQALTSALTGPSATGVPGATVGTDLRNAVARAVAAQSGVAGLLNTQANEATVANAVQWPQQLGIGQKALTALGRNVTNPAADAYTNLLLGNQGTPMPTPAPGAGTSSVVAALAAAPWLNRGPVDPMTGRPPMTITDPGWTGARPPGQSSGGGTDPASIQQQLATLPAQWRSTFTTNYLWWLVQNRPGADANDAAARQAYTDQTGLGATIGDPRNPMVGGGLPESPSGAPTPQAATSTPSGGLIGAVPNLNVTPGANLDPTTAALVGTAAPFLANPPNLNVTPGANLDPTTAAYAKTLMGQPSTLALSPQWTRDFRPDYLLWLLQNRPGTDANDARARQDYTNETGQGATIGDLQSPGQDTAAQQQLDALLAKAPDALKQTPGATWTPATGLLNTMPNLNVVPGQNLDPTTASVVAAAQKALAAPGTGIPGSIPTYPDVATTDPTTARLQSLVAQAAAGIPSPVTARNIREQQQAMENRMASLEGPGWAASSPGIYAQTLTTESGNVQKYQDWLNTLATMTPLELQSFQADFARKYQAGESQFHDWLAEVLGLNQAAISGMQLDVNTAQENIRNWLNAVGTVGGLQQRGMEFDVNTAQRNIENWLNTVQGLTGRAQTGMQFAGNTRQQNIANWLNAMQGVGGLQNRAFQGNVTNQTALSGFGTPQPPVSVANAVNAMVNIPSLTGQGVNPADATTRQENELLSRFALGSAEQQAAANQGLGASIANLFGRAAATGFGNTLLGDRQFTLTPAVT